MATHVFKLLPSEMEPIVKGYKSWFQVPHDRFIVPGDRIAFTEIEYPDAQLSGKSISFNICLCETLFQDNATPLCIIVSFGPLHVSDYILQKGCE